MRVNTEVHRWWEGENIPALGWSKLYKSLGVELSPKGDVILPWDAGNQTIPKNEYDSEFVTDSRRVWVLHNMLGDLNIDK